MDGGAVIARTSRRQIRVGHSLGADNIHIRLTICHSTPDVLRFNPTLPIRITIDDEGWNSGIRHPKLDGLEDGVEHEAHRGWKRIHNASREGVVRECPIQHVPIVIASGIVEMGRISYDVDEPARGVAATTTIPTARTVGATLARSACSSASIDRDVDDNLLWRLWEDVECSVCNLNLHHDPAWARLL